MGFKMLPPKVIIYVTSCRRWTASVVLWSEFLATDPGVQVRFPALQIFLVVGLEQDPLCLVNTIEELLGRKVAAPV
jgi:hypothetical protein